MNSKALLSTSSLRRACMLSIVLAVPVLATNAAALDEPKVTITYSLKTADDGAYWQKLSGTPLGLGDVDFVFDTDDSLDPKVNVTRADPLTVTIEYTADLDGKIIDGPVELTQTDFGRDFVLTTTGTEVTTVIDTELSQKGTGWLSGSAAPPATITWDTDTYKETVGPGSESDCVGSFCGLGEPPGGWPRDLDAVDRPVDLPTFTVFENTFFGDEFASDNGTPNDPSDDIPRPDPSAEVRETWYGMVPEPSGEILLLAGVLGLAGLHRLRERGGASA